MDILEVLLASEIVEVRLEFFWKFVRVHKLFLRFKFGWEFKLDFESRCSEFSLRVNAAPA